MQENYCILDFETTGLSHLSDRVIEIGAVKVREGKIVDQFESFINPRRPLPAIITSLTGITNQMVRSAPLAEEVFPKLKIFVEADHIIAHNAAFDSGFFVSEMNRLAHRPQNNFLCTLMLARRIYPELKSHKLEVLCSHLHLHNDRAHRALSDVKVTLQVFQAICNQIKEKSQLPSLRFEHLSLLSKISKTEVPNFLSKLK